MKELSPEQWLKADVLFDEALDHAEDERTAFLRARCGDDVDLYTRVLSLLESEPAAVDALGENAAAIADAMLRREGFDPNAEPSPLSVGAYRIVSPLGRGGMGMVYLAERADGTFQKSVALKLVKRGMDTDEVLRRFRYERQILAGLDHPNIARILDAGVAGDGRPYFVMEYCDGDTITRFADSEKLGIEQRLELFEQVCDAVAYAHRHLVVHRDLKPGNILVTIGEDNKPSVKLLDFGIARLLDEQSDHHLTQVGQRILTPEYAAPEQVRGEPVTTAADVYALGVVLHELLVGTRPEAPLERPRTIIDVRKLTDEIADVRGTSRDGLRRELRSDLDAIVIKALQADPLLRYASADALLDDLKRRKSGLPLTASRSTVGYRVGKFVRRHRWGVAVATVAAVALLSFVAALDQQRRETIQERDIAQANEAFLKNLFESADPFSVETSRPDTLRAVHLLDRGVERARRAYIGKPMLLANTLQTVGSVYIGLGMFATADSLLSEVVETRRELLDRDNPALSESLHELASVRSYMGQYAQAESLYTEALELRKSEYGEGSIQYAQTLVDMGWNQTKFGKLDDAEQLTARALEIQKRAGGERTLSVASTMTNAARIAMSLGRPADAEVTYRRALEIRRELLPDKHLIVAESLDNLGASLQEQRKLDEAETYLREALEIRQSVLGDNHSSVADTRYNLAIVVRNQGNYEEALELMRLVRQANEINLGPDHPYVGYNLITLGVTQSQMGDELEALESYKQAYEVLRRTLPETHGAVLEALNGQGYQYVRTGQAARGEQLLRKVYTTRLEYEGPTSWRTGMTQSALGQALMEQGKNQEAEVNLVQGYERIRDASGPQHAALQRLISFYRKADKSEKVAQYQALFDAL